MQSALSTSAPAVTGTPRIISQAESDIVKSILQEFAQLQTARSMFAGQWEEAAQLILPTSRNTFFYGNYNTQGIKKTQQQVDASGALALHRFCAIADSLVTPRSQQWHGLEADDEYVMKDRATRLWFEGVARKLFKYRYANNSGFSGQNYNTWQSIGAFGNATMFVDAFDGRLHHGARGLRYKAVPLGETFFGESHQGIVDRMIRWFRLTAYQAVQKWGREALPAGLESALQSNSQWLYDFLHCVKPREDYDPERLDAKGMPFCSYYVSMQGQCLMGPEGGYRIFPFGTRRYDQTPGEAYGRGPAQIVLPALKTLNAEKATFLKQGHRAADPVLLIADDGVVGMDLRPGAMNKGGVTSDGRPLVHTLPTGNIATNEKMMAMERGLIDDTFLVSLFQVLTEHPNMTATQVIELVNEKGMLVAPTLGRQHDEMGQMVERELDLLAAQRLLDPPPPRLAEAMRYGDWRVRVTDTSPIGKAARAGEAAAFMRTVESVKELVNITQDTSLLDRFDFDTAIPEIANIGGVRESWMAGDDDVAAKRRARAQAQRQQEQIQALPAQAAMLKAQATVAKAQPGMAQGQAFGGPQPGAPQ